MTGPELYRAALEDAEMAERRTATWPGVSPDATLIVEAITANTKATLALAAATALAAVDPGATLDRTAHEWRAVIVPPRD